jgi:hypothetical protein
MSRALVFGSVIALAGVASADDTRFSDAYADGSTTLFLGSMWSPGPTVPIRIGAEGAVRVNYKHIAFEARGGFGGSGTINGFGSQIAWHLGAAAGVALATGKYVVISPMASYDYFGTRDSDGTTVNVHYLTLELPLAIVLGRGVVLEAVAQLGMARYQGATDPAIVIGPRIGIVL